MRCLLAELSTGLWNMRKGLNREREARRVSHVMLRQFEHIGQTRTDLSLWGYKLKNWKGFVNMRVAIGCTLSAKILHCGKRSRLCIKNSGFLKYYCMATKFLYIIKNQGQCLEKSSSSIHIFGYN